MPDQDAIDCDIHPGVPDIAALLPYMHEFWKESFVDRGLDVERGPVVELAADLLVLVAGQRRVAHLIDRAPLADGHQPRAGISRNAGLGPPFQRGDERVVREILGGADVAGDPREPGDQPGGFNSPDGVDGAVDRGIVHGLKSVRARFATQPQDFVFL